MLGTRLSKEEWARILERLRRLLALGGAAAQDDPRMEEEARTSARLACQLLMKHQIALSAPSEPGAKKPLSGVAKAAAAWANPRDDADPSTQVWAKAPGRNRPNDLVVEMKAQRFSKCVVCDRIIGVGDWIAWHRRAEKAACLTPCGVLLKAGEV